MRADDPRHGEYAGAVQHWFDKEPLCPPCKRAETRYRKRRQLAALRGAPATLPALGTVRRFQALQALGWSGPHIAKEAGVSVDTMRALIYHRSGRVTVATAAKIDAAYNRLSMTRPEGGYANRNRGLAQRKGYAPPLAFDDIDDPNEQPKGVGVSELDRAETLRDLAEMGYGITEAVRRLDLNRDAMQKWCSSHGLADVYRALARREAVRANQYDEQGAA